MKLERHAGSNATHCSASFVAGKHAALRGCHRILFNPSSEEEESQWLAGFDSIAAANRGKWPVTGPVPSHLQHLAGQAAPQSALGMVNGLRWHFLTGLTFDGEYTEVEAATCIDGISVIVRWVKEQGEWTAEALDAESCQWQLVEQDDEANEIPPEPPTVWDDRECHSWQNY